MIRYENTILAAMDGIVPDQSLLKHIPEGGPVESGARPRWTPLNHEEEGVLDSDTQTTAAPPPNPAAAERPDPAAQADLRAASKAAFRNLVRNLGERAVRVRTAFASRLARRVKPWRVLLNQVRRLLY
jgi:hypothetical protein